MIVGMDFGTTNSGMSVFDGDQLRLIPLDPANSNPHVSRTALYITNDNTVHIGADATQTYYQQNLNRPFKLEQVRVGEVEMTFAEIGTFIRDVYIDKDVYAPGRLFLSFKMGLSSPRYLGTVVGNHYYYLEDIIATYLYTTRVRAQAHLDRDLDTIVLGRPVRYTDDQDHNRVAQERMLQAAFRAGYKTVYLQYEPIAAAYHYESGIHNEENVLIFDFGGGTLDISIMRLGNPKTRAVLATGGIAIAGDVFDSKIVRGKFPKHFGEGTSYVHGHTELPIPSAFYDAFDNWQSLLEFQMPDQIDRLKTIAQTAKSRRKINALVDLISSSYALKMFDVAETAKRTVSEQPLALMHLDGPGFDVHDSLTRGEFERLIRSEVRAISERLDEVIAQAGLKPHQIDSVIRTGGSSQIPAFIDMLEDRFGAGKIRHIDAFSSVTAGLGLIAHEIAAGNGQLTAHHAADYPLAEYLQADTQGGIPTLDFDQARRYIDLGEADDSSDTDSVVLVHQRESGNIYAGPLQAEMHLDTPTNPVIIARPDAEIVLLSNEYRSFVKPARYLADMATIGISFEESERFEADAFGSESIHVMQAIDDLRGAERVLLLARRGYGRAFIGEPLLQKLARPVPYQIPRTKSDPAALVRADAGGDVLIVNSAGSAIRLCADRLSLTEERLMKVSGKAEVIGAVFIHADDEIICATASGYAKRIAVNDIPQAASPDGDMTKLMSRSNTVSVCIYRAHQPMWAITSRRILPVDSQAIPPIHPDEKTDHKPIKLRKGERLLALATL